MDVGGGGVGTRSVQWFLLVYTNDISWHTWSHDCQRGEGEFFPARFISDGFRNFPQNIELVFYWVCQLQKYFITNWHNNIFGWRVLRPPCINQVCFKVAFWLLTDNRVVTRIPPTYQNIVECILKSLSHKTQSVIGSHRLIVQELVS